MNFAERHSDSRGSLMRWFKMVRASQWKNFIEARRQFPAADAVHPFTIFNVGGNKYRIVAEIDYRKELVIVHEILTHAEYDKGAWRK